MKKAFKVMKFGFFLSLVFVLGFILSNFDAKNVLAQSYASIYNYHYNVKPYPYHVKPYPYKVKPYPYNLTPYPYYSFFGKNKDVDDKKIVVPTREEVSILVAKILK